MPDPCRCAPGQVRTANQARCGNTDARSGKTGRWPTNQARRLAAVVAHKVVNSSPCQGTKLPKRLPVEVTPLATATVHALADAVPERYRALVVLAAGTGMRQGECFGLDIDHLDLDNHSLRVEQQLVLLPYRDPFLGPPKTPASHRTIPLPQVVVDTLTRHLISSPSGTRTGSSSPTTTATLYAGPGSPARSGAQPSQP
ncbi:site-specific integrase [Pseudonocardia humida]|uniref:site-specific integrase n=1 Tax=Pseudonocardia humida TaxID=2800819 RepID=UPI00207C2CCB|nr:tyrosine-type recombinase/integrase [Pseudonocardia humida]